MSDAAYCPECNNVYRVFDECPQCLVKLQKPSINHNISGNNNQSIFVNGTNSGAIHIGSPQEKKPDNTTYIQRSDIKPLRLGGKPIKNWWNFAIGGLGVLGSFASIISLLVGMAIKQEPIEFPVNPIVIPIFMVISASLLLIGTTLKLSKYIRMPFFTIEVDRKGYLYKSRITGQCGLCKYPVKLTVTGSKDHQETVLQCTQNPNQHVWMFDPTVLDDVGDAYKYKS